MPTEELIALECPYCRDLIHRPLNWFKQPYFTCPACAGGLTENQFATIIHDLEQAFEQTIAEMLQPRPSCGCCNKKVA